MKTIFALTVLGACALVDAQYTVSSKAFKLVLRSTNSTLDGTSLGACHQGAALEDLCFSPRSRGDYYTPFNHNTSYSGPGVFKHNPGILYYTLNAHEQYPSAMALHDVSTSNIAIPIFAPGNSTYTAVYFTERGVMYIPNWTADTQRPPEHLQDTEMLENWYICLTKYMYLRETLVWKIGVKGEPQNPSCQKVRVEREFVE